MAILADRLKQVLRRLGRTPVFTAITLLTLAISIGANTVIFSVVESVVLKPLPYLRSGELIGVWHTAPGINMPELNMAPFLYFTYREQNTTLQDIGVYTRDSFSITGNGEPEQAFGIDVSAATLPILGVQPVLGRLFTQADDTPGAPETAILTYDYWQRKFGGSQSVLGQVFYADGRPRQIIGVLPKNFQFLDYDERSIVVPFQWDRSKTHLGSFSYEALARLKPGVTLQQASADLNRLIPIALRGFPAPEGFSAKVFESAGITPNLHPLKHDVIGDIGDTLWILMGSILMVLLIACANVANLLLVRVEGRRQELAIRSALGAAWKQLAGDLLLESLILGFAGSALGIAVAWGALRILVSMAPSALPRIHEIGIDLPVLLFALALAFFTSLLIAAMPVLKFAGAHLNSSLREGGRGQSQSREQHRTRNALVVLQVALALVLLICSGLMIRTFRALAHVDPGFRDPQSVQTVNLFIPETTLKDATQTLHAEQAIRDQAAAIPGVTSAALTSGIPLSGSDSFNPLYAQDHVYAANQIPPIRHFCWISPGYFATMGTALVAGRDYTWDDLYSKLPVAIISENFAREYWGTPANALGKQIRVASTEPWRQIVGVVQDVHDDGLSQPAPTTVYWPALMGPFENDQERIQRSISLVLRTSRAGSQPLLKEIQRAVWSTDSNLPLAHVRTLGYYYNRSMASTSFTLVMLSVAGGMALLLGVIGIYGVISYAVTQRTREIGIRMALGAQRQAITNMFVRHGLILTAIGSAIGLVAAFFTMRLMSSLLFHVSPVDPATYILITLGIASAAAIACYLPSRRAASVEPVHALRAE